MTEKNMWKNLKKLTSRFSVRVVLTAVFVRNDQIEIWDTLLVPRSIQVKIRKWNYFFFNFGSNSKYSSFKTVDFVFGGKVRVFSKFLSRKNSKINFNKNLIQHFSK